jgi:hypothetical protein
LAGCLPVLGERTQMLVMHMFACIKLGHAMLSFFRKAAGDPIFVYTSKTIVE